MNTYRRIVRRRAQAPLERHLRTRSGELEVVPIEDEPRWEVPVEVIDLDTGATRRPPILAFRTRRRR